MIKFYGTPWKTWKKARKYFRFPNIRLRASLFPNLFIYFLHWYDFIYICDINWKSKYSEPRHEDNPCIVLNFFNYFQVKLELGRWIQGKDYSMQYWESLLCYTVFGMSLHESLKFSIWVDSKGNKTPITKVCLKKYKCLWK